jgi:hypothetical protein
LARPAHVGRLARRWIVHETQQVVKRLGHLRKRLHKDKKKKDLKKFFSLLFKKKQFQIYKYGYRWLINAVMNNRV